MKQLFILICLNILITNSNICQQNNSTQNHLHIKAGKLFNEFKYDSAAICYLKAAKLYEEQTNWYKAARNYRYTAHALIQPVKADSALYYLEKAINIANTYFNDSIKKDVYEKVLIYKTKGHAFSKLGKYKKEINYYKKGIQLVKWNDKKSENILAKLYNITGNAHRFLQEYKTAAYYCEKALSLRIKNLGEKHDDVAKTQGNLGLIYLEMYDFDKAAKKFIIANSIIGEIYGNDHPYQASGYNNMGLIYHNKGDFKKAHQAFSKSLQLRVKGFGADHPEVANTLENIGNSYFKNGRYGYASEYYYKALNLRINKLGSAHPKISNTYINLGLISSKMNEHAKALSYYKKALNIRIERYGKESVALSPIYGSISTLYQNKKEYNKALQYANMELASSVKIYGENNLGIASTYNNIGSIYLDTKNYNTALEYFLKSLTIYRKEYGEQHYLTNRAYNNIGSTYFSDKRFNEALKYYQKALVSNLTKFNDTSIYSVPEHLECYSKSILVNTLCSKAMAIHSTAHSNDSLNLLKVSLSTYQLLFRLINEMRSDFSHESSQLILSENIKRYLSDAILASIKYYNVKINRSKRKKVFDFFEKSKSTTLSAHLNNDRINKYRMIPDSLTDKERDISINRRFYETSIQKAKANKSGYDTAMIQNFQNKLFNYLRQYDSLMIVIKDKYPDYYQLKYQQNVVNIDELQKKLDDKTTLLNYFVADTTLFIAAVTKDSLVYKMVKTDSSFNEQLTDYHIDIGFDFTKSELQASTKLYNYLIAPVEDLIKGKNKLVIIPDERLYYVPFETLCKKGEDISQPDYLIKDYAINYHHSATLWLNSKEKESKNVTQNNFIGFAPVFDPEVNNGSILSNEWLTDTTDTEMATRSVSSDFTNYNALPNSEKEIKSILKLFKKKDGKAEGYLHKKATEENFKQEANKYKYVHIASHSFTNDKYPALSGIAFSQPDTTQTTEETEDGILYAGESYNLNLSKADLVVLSSCKSGLGKLIKGEGFLSLSRGFIYSGAPNIVYSLWSVNDEPTKNLMVRFYKQLLNGKSYAEALREAKLKILSNSKTAQPKYWAAWVLLGK